MIIKALIISLVWWLMVGCTAQAVTPQPAPDIMSAWGRVVPITPADHWQAPAIHAEGGRIMLAWAGADEQEARLYAGALGGVEAISGRILALKAHYPQDIRLYQAGRDTYHLLWLDAENAGDTLRLRSALIDADGVALVGALTLSEATTSAYHALPLPDGGLRVVYSAGDVGAIALYTRTIDAGGRANFSVLLSVRLQADVRYPQVVVDMDGIRLYWLEHRRIFSILWDDALDVTMHPIAQGAVTIADSGRILAFEVFHQDGWAVAIAQVWGDEVVPSIWWASAPIGEAFGQFAPLRLSLAGSAYDSGYNGGQAQIVVTSDEGEGVRWLGTVGRTERIAPTVITWGDELGVLFWEGGEVGGYQRIMSEVRGQLDAPRITTAPDRHLSVTWWLGDAYALTTTQR